MQVWERKAAESRALIAQVKAMHADTKTVGGSGINSGEKATVARKLMAEAKRLGEEAKAARDSFEADKAKALLEQFKSGKNVDLSDVEKNRKVAGQEPEENLYALGNKKPVLLIEKGLAKRFYGTREAGNFKSANTKILSEGSGANGEYLVVPEYHQEMFAEIRSQGNALRNLGWVNVHPTRSSSVKIPRGAGATTMAWVGQNQPAPSSDLTTSQLTVNIYKAVGIAKVTFEEDQDSDPAAMDLSIEDLARRAAILEETAWLNGSGTDEAYGILNTSGVLTKTYANTIDTQQEQIDYILDQAMDVLANYYAPATGVLMAPRRYAFLRKAKDDSKNYLFNLPSTFRAPGAVTKSIYDGGDILGLPIGMSPNMPITLGSGTNEDRIIVGYWPELHAFIRLEQTIDYNDRSDTAWSNDQKHVRLKFRQGSTAGRQPKAFSVGGGAGLAVV